MRQPTSENSIAFVDLVAKCGYDDGKQFFYTLKKLGIPTHTISKDGRVDKPLANKIAKLLGHTIDWYQHKQHLRDRKDGGPLRHLTRSTFTTEHSEYFDIIASGYSRIEPRGIERNEDRTYILGIASKGGYLGEPQSLFAVPFHQGVNVFIGARGSGKSSVLNLCGITAESVTARSETLVGSVLNAIAGKADEADAFPRTMRDLLRSYDISLLCVYVLASCAIRCLLIDSNAGLYGGFTLTLDGWDIVDELPSSYMPSLLYFKQGEVVRIADANNANYLCNILDTIFPSLQAQRKQLATQLNQLLKQSQPADRRLLETEPSPLSLYPEIRQGAWDYFRARTKDIQTISRAIHLLRNGNNPSALCRDVIRTLRGYLSGANPYMPAIREASILEFFEESAFDILYIGRIAGYLKEAVQIVDYCVDSLHASSIPNAEEPFAIHEAGVVPQDAASSLIPNDSIDADINAWAPGTGDEVAQDGEFSDIDGEASEDGMLDEATPAPSQAAEAPLPSDPQAVTDMLTSKLSEIEGFLDRRLAVFRRWLRILTRPRVPWGPELEGIATSYRALLKSRRALLADQIAACQQIEKKINRDNLHGRRTVVNSSASTSVRKRDEELVKLLAQADNNYRRISSLRILSREWLSDIDDKYNKAVYAITHDLFDLINKPELHEPFVYQPIAIEFLLGARYLPFEKLSFGQKCGVILNIVLGATRERSSVILIDQPEDHLDARAVNEMLVPMLSELAADHQLMIASHSLNIVMLLPEPRVIVLEPCGDYGRLQTCGSSASADVLLAMLDVLEGGSESLQSKLDVFDRFLERHLSIQDTEIATIEREFRRNTIDELRNALQPVISDRFIMTTIRHDLRNIRMSKQGPTALESQIQALRHSIQQQKESPSSSLSLLDSTCLHLETHIAHLSKAIDEIRMLDTHPQPSAVNLGVLLSELRNLFAALPQFGVDGRQLSFSVDPALDSQIAFADPQHLKLILRNLLYNSLRATERRYVDRILRSHQNRPLQSPFKVSDTFTESVTFTLLEATEDHIRFSLQDNGCGIAADILPQLYVERVTSQERSENHGWGSVIIKKLLQLNGGNIHIMSTIVDGEENMGTTQSITMPKVGHSK